MKLVEFFLSKFTSSLEELCHTVWGSQDAENGSAGCGLYFVFSEYIEQINSQCRGQILQARFYYFSMKKHR
jgi:hypothetical protein